MTQPQNFSLETLSHEYGDMYSKHEEFSTLVSTVPSARGLLGDLPEKRTQQKLLSEIKDKTQVRILHLIFLYAVRSLKHHVFTFFLSAPECIPSPYSRRTRIILFDLIQQKISSFASFSSFLCPVDILAVPLRAIPS